MSATGYNKIDEKAKRVTYFKGMTVLNKKIGNFKYTSIEPEQILFCSN